MIEIRSKKQLAIILSRLKGFEEPNWKLEQYQTESEIAAEIAWSAFSRREIQNKVVVDLGCGTGILGLSTLLLGASKVFLVDIDDKSIKIAKENLRFLEEYYEVSLEKQVKFIVSDIKFFDEKVDLVIENPPFGIKRRDKADKAFLEKAFSISKLIYSFHMAESKGFIKAISSDFGFNVTEYYEFDWPLKQTMHYHKKKINYVKVGCWKMVKNS